MIFLNLIPDNRGVLAPRDEGHLMAQISLEKITKVYPNGFEAVHAA